MISGWVAAAIAIVVWGVTFASTRVLLEEFSALEINIARFALAWVALACAADVPRGRAIRITVTPRDCFGLAGNAIRLDCPPGALAG